MEAVKTRTRLALGQAARKRRILDKKLLKRDRRRLVQGNTPLQREELDAHITARKRQREDWALGALKPWREQVGLQEIDAHDSEGASISFEDAEQAGREEKGLIRREANPEWGTWMAQRLRKPTLPRDQQLVRRELVIRVGDRVCVTEGREGTKGKIGKVTSIDCESGHVEVEGVNMIEIEVPPLSRQPGEDPIRSQPEPVPYSSLRLVYPIPQRTTHTTLNSSTEEPETTEAWTYRDAILTDLTLQHAKPEEDLPEKEERQAYEYERSRHDESFSTHLHDNRCEYFPPLNRLLGPRYRYLMPSGLRIPWPAVPERNAGDRPGDTLRSIVEERSFVPTLLRPPMPESVIDELRHKYSKFRTRHEDEFVAKKEEEDRVAEERRAGLERMKSKGARNLARDGRGRAAGKGRGPKENGVDVRVLDALGRHLAAKRGMEVPEVRNGGKATSNAVA